MEFKSVLFPPPVEPAIRRCGKTVRSSTIIFPLWSIPSRTGSFAFDVHTAPTESLNCKSLRSLLGTYIPMEFSDGIRAICTDSTPSEIAISSDRFSTCETFVLFVGTNRYRETMGPTDTSGRKWPSIFRLDSFSWSFART